MLAVVAAAFALTPAMSKAATMRAERRPRIATRTLS